jgi:hypothetical protein
MARSRSGIAAAALAALSTALGVALALGPASPVAADQVHHADWGHVKGHNAVLKRGCHTYTYSYAITPPPGDWAIEIFITGPGPHDTHGRVGLANTVFVDGFDPEVGTGHFILCRPTTRDGRFTIKTRLSVQDGPDSYTEGWLPVAHFRLRAPGHR